MMQQSIMTLETLIAQLQDLRAFIEREGLHIQAEEVSLRIAVLRNQLRALRVPPITD